VGLQDRKAHIQKLFNRQDPPSQGPSTALDPLIKESGFHSAESLLNDSPWNHDSTNSPCAVTECANFERSREA
jgi:hypothetical protein